MVLVIVNFYIDVGFLPIILNAIPHTRVVKINYEALSIINKTK
jgi:hypothetical protein